MKEVVISPPVEIALRTLDDDGRRRVHALFDTLKNWDHDESVRKNSRDLEHSEGVKVLKTTTDIRIFFRVEGERITILDIAKKAAIVSSGRNAGVG